MSILKGWAWGWAITYIHYWCSICILWKMVKANGGVLSWICCGNGLDTTSNCICSSVNLASIPLPVLAGFLQYLLFLLMLLRLCDPVWTTGYLLQRVLVQLALIWLASRSLKWKRLFKYTCIEVVNQNGPFCHTTRKLSPLDCSVMFHSFRDCKHTPG